MGLLKAEPNDGSGPGKLNLRFAFGKEVAVISLYNA